MGMLHTAGTCPGRDMGIFDVAVLFLLSKVAVDDVCRSADKDIGDGVEK